jgi:cytochrome P450
VEDDAGAFAGALLYASTMPAAGPPLEFFHQRERVPRVTTPSAATVRSLPPGPPGHFLVGNLPELVRDWAGFFERCARDYGDVVYVRFLKLPICLLTHPDHIESVLVTHQANFRKARDYRALGLVLGDGLLTAEGEEWRRQRRLIQPAFQRDQLARFADVVVDEAERMLAGWRGAEIRDAHAEMMRVTLGIVARTLFGADVSGETRRVGVALDVIMRQFNALAGLALLLPERFPLVGTPSLRREVRHLDRIVYGIIRERRASGHAADDLLGRLLRALDDSGRGMSDRQLRDEIMTLFLAGHETTALALSWTWLLLSQHPAVEARLAEELRAVLRERPPGMDDLDRLPYTAMVLKEALRLYPPVYAIGREALGAFDVGPYRLPARTTVFLAQWLTHRDPRLYEEPERFIPERWADDPIRRGRLPRFAYFPFGGGPRVCVGAGFAMMEATLLLATIARRFRLTLAPGHTVEVLPSVTLRPRNGVRVVLERRD